MSLLRFIAIACLAIVGLILFFSNLTPTLPLVFLGRSTVPIAVGTMVLGAIGSGLVISLILRLLMFGQRPRRQTRPAATDFSYEPAPNRETRREFDRDYQPEIIDEEPARRRPQQAVEPDLDSNPPRDGVYDANYRVINQPSPRTMPPEVGSNLRSDSEDWGFDFEDEDEPRK
jgi:hypothetical protein